MFGTNQNAINKYINFKHSDLFENIREKPSNKDFILIILSNYYCIIKKHVFITIK